MNSLKVPLLGIFVGGIQVSVFLPVFIFWRLYNNLFDPLGLAVAALYVLLTFIPLRLCTNKWTHRLMREVCGACLDYCPIKIVHEDEDAIKPGRPYMIAYEPHSAMPVGLPAVFSPTSPKLPKWAQADKLHGLASSICFVAPIVRQLFYWVGLRPASRAVADKHLANQESVLVCPGGVQECLTMEKNLETVYLRRRHGFVKLALKHGAPLVPVFAFGQSRTYSWWRPPGVKWISRNIGAVPLIVWGAFGTPILHRSPVTVVIGKPIEVPKIEQPSQEDAEHYLQKFIAEMTAMFERHRVSSGCGAMSLRVL